MLSPEELVRRARERCKQHRQPGVGGVCRQCLLAEIEQRLRVLQVLGGEP